MGKHTKAAEQYARDVISGGIPACKWVRAAAQRQLDDLERQGPDWPYVYDEEQGEKWCRFVQLMPHVKGKWANPHIRLDAWQQFAICCVYGWVHRDTRMRRFRTAYWELPRKNAKTTVAGALALGHLTIDGELGAEVYTAATTREQAKIVFDIAKTMVGLEPEFRTKFGVRLYLHSIAVDETGSKMVPLSAEGSTLDGLNISAAIVDELHAHRTRKVHDVIDSSLGSRAQPLIWKITTAGSDRSGVCYDQRLYLSKILNATLKRHGGMGYRLTGNAIEDDITWGIIYTVDMGADKLGDEPKDDDPFDEAIWRKANPGYEFLDKVDFTRMATKAKAQTQALGEFLTKRLNIWISADQGWMNMLDWDACADPGLREEDFEGETCWVGLDAGFKADLFAKIKVFQRDDHYYIFGRYYAPEKLVEAEGNEHLKAWSLDGWIRVCDGTVNDIHVVESELVGDAETRGDVQRFHLSEVAFDPNQLTPFAADMLEQGLPMVEMRPNVLNFSAPMKELAELVSSRKLHHNGDPVLAWMTANVVCHRDGKDNIYPNKERPENKIDGAVALIMAIGRAMVNRPGKPSYWEQVVAERAAAAGNEPARLPPLASGDGDGAGRETPVPVVVNRGRKLSYWEQVAQERLEEKKRNAESADHS